MYAIIALAIRLVLAALLFQKGQLALSSRTRNFTNTVELGNVASLLLGFYVYPFTMVLLILLGVRIWQKRKRGSASWRIGRDLIILIFALIIFLKGPGQFSLDKLVGNI